MDTGATGESACGLPPSSMLYSGSDIIRDLEWVIFDEVHYINDAEVRSRGPWGPRPAVLG